MARKKRTTPRVIVVKKELQKKLNNGISRRQIEKEANLARGSVHFFLKRYKGVAKRKSILEKLERYLKTDSTIQPKSKGVITIFSKKKMSKLEMDKISKQLSFFKNRAIQGRQFQTSSFIFLIIGLLLYVLTEIHFFKVAVVTGCVGILISIFYLSFIIDPLWKKEIEKYKKVTEEYFKSQK